MCYFVCPTDSPSARLPACLSVCPVRFRSRSQFLHFVLWLYFVVVPQELILHGQLNRNDNLNLKSTATTTFYFIINQCFL